MTLRRFILSSGSNQVPIDDGTYLTDEFSRSFTKWTVTVRFVDSSGDTVTPTAGTVTPMLLATTDQWITPSSGDSSVDCTECGETATYSIPTFDGSGQQGRVVLSDVAGTGIDHAEIIFTGSN